MMFVQILAVIGVGFIEEVCVADSDPVEFRLFVKLNLQLGIFVLVDLAGDIVAC